MYSSFALLALATLALAKTDIGGCSQTTTLNQYGNSVIGYYVPGTGEICEILDCGGGRAPPKTTVPGCAAYEGTSTYSPKYLSLGPATTTSSTPSSTPVVEKSTLTSAQSAQATSTAASSSASASAPAVTSSAVVSTSASIQSSSTLTTPASVSSSAAASGSSSKLSTVTTSSATAASNGTTSGSTPSPIQAVPNSAMGSLNAMGGLMVVAAGFAILL